MADLLVDLAVRSAIVAACAALLAVLVRRRAASSQALLLSAALVGLLALPLGAWLAPAWNLPVLPPSEPTMTTPQVSTAAPGLLETTASSYAPTVVGGTPVEAQVYAAETPAVAAWPDLMRLPVVLAVAWLAGLTLILTRLAGSYRALSRLVEESEPVCDPRWQAAVSNVSAELGISRAVRVASSPDASVPIVAGLLRPTIVIPEEAAEWPATMIGDVVRHELAHVARWDGLGQLVGQIACAVYWFNPITWLLARRACALREQACDDEVLRVGTRASEYADRLLALVRLQHGQARRPAALAMASPAHLRHRVMRLLDPTTRRGRVGPSAAIPSVGTAIAIAVLTATAQPVVRADATVDLPALLSFADWTPAPDQSSDLHPTREPTGLHAPSTTGEPAVRTQASQGLCDGSPTQSSTSTNDSDGERHWRIRYRSADCDVDFRVDGGIDFNDDFTDVASLDAGGVLRLDATVDGVRRHLEMRNRGGTLERTYEVNGRTAPWDQAARDWFARFLIELDRRTAVGMKIRLPRLLEQGGVRAVLAETGAMTSDHARTTYYRGLLDARQLPPADRRALIEQAAALTRSDHYAAEALKKVVVQGRLSDVRERDAAVAMIKQMRSDHYRAEVMKMLGGNPLTVEQTNVLLDVLDAMQSDHYRHEVLTTLAADAPNNLDLTTAATVIRHMKSDHYRTEAVHALGERHLNASQAATLLPLVGDMSSDHYRVEVIRTLLDVPATEATLLSAVSLIRGMRSDHYAAEALGAVLANRGATDVVKAAVREAAGTLARSYRDRVLAEIR